MRSRESDVPHGIFKGLGRGVASRGARHADARIRLPEPGSRERSGRDFQDGQSRELPAWLCAPSGHLCTWDWELEGNQGFKVILHS